MKKFLQESYPVRLLLVEKFFPKREKKHEAITDNNSVFLIFMAYLDDLLF